MNVYYQSYSKDYSIWIPKSYRHNYGFIGIIFNFIFVLMVVILQIINFLLLFMELPFVLSFKGFVNLISIFLAQVLSTLVCLFSNLIVKEMVILMRSKNLVYYHFSFRQKLLFVYILTKQIRCDFLTLFILKV